MKNGSPPARTYNKENKNKDYVAYFIEACPNALAVTLHSSTSMNPTM